MLPLDVVRRVFDFMGDMSLPVAVRRRDLALVELLVAVDKTQCTAALMDDAAARGDLAMVQFLHRASPAGCTTKAMDEAARYGRLEVVQFLCFNRAEGCTSVAACQAIAARYVPVARFLIQHYPKRIRTCMLRHAVWYNYPEIVVDYLRLRPDAKKVDAKEDAMKRNGVTLELVKLMYEMGNDKTPSRALILSVGVSDPVFMKYLVEQGEGFIVEAMVQAVRFGFVDKLEYLLDKAQGELQPSDQSGWVDIAATNGHRAMVAFLRERFPEIVCSIDVLDRAARRGDQAMVELLHRPNRQQAAGIALRTAATNGKSSIVQHLAVDCDSTSVTEAAKIALENGLLDLANFLVWVSVTRRERECGATESDEDAHSAPASDHRSGWLGKKWCLGALEAVDWYSNRSRAHTEQLISILGEVIQRGTSERSDQMLVQAASRGDLDVVTDLVERNIGDLHLAAMAAIRRGHVGVVRYLIESTQLTQRKPVGPVNWMAEAARTGHLGVLTYLHETVPGLVCRPKAMDHAASLGYMEVVRFLHFHRTEGCTTKAMDGAAYGDHPEVVRFLHEHRTEGCSKRAFEKSAERGLTEMVTLLLEITPATCNVKKGIELAKAHQYDQTVAVLEDYLATQAL